MKTRNIIAALFLMVAGLQTTWAQGFRVYKSDGTVAQYSLRTDSIVFYEDIGSDVDINFDPFTPVNRCIVGTWYKTKYETVTFNEDGTTDYMEGATYKFFPYQGNIIIYNASDAPVNYFKVIELRAGRMIVCSPDGSNISIWSRTMPVYLVESIELSETLLFLEPDGTKRFTATVLPEDADNKEVVWESSDEAVAQIINDGLVLALAEGTCTITCSATDGSGVKAECQVTVTDGQMVMMNGISFKMIPVEGGTFQMGSTTGENDEQPVHQVTLNSFSIGQTEVTQELWEAVMGSNPSNFKSNKRPVEKVNWNDCQKFIAKLNQLTGKTFRLPTEAEWEFAARGGNKSNGYTYSGSNTLNDVAWYTSNSSNTTHDVGTKTPNELGIYDMSGNVWEWCQDWYSSIYYSNSPINNPTGATSGTYRVTRGGSWSNPKGWRSTTRGISKPTDTNSDLGFRLAL